MKNTFKLNVNEPCSEKFENFAPTGQGGFCSTCQKEVIDFTGLFESELVAHFSNKKENTCGRFYKTQLKEYQTMKTMQTTSHSKSLGLMGFSLLALCATTTLNAQADVALGSTGSIEIMAPTAVDGQVGQTEQFRVKGTVLDEENLPLPGVNVVLKGTSEGVQTDFDGKFEFPRALKVDDTLVFSYIGYGKREFTIKAGEPENIEVTIAFDSADIELMGEVVIGGAYTSKRNIFQKFFSIFK